MTDTPTPDEIARWAALADAATPGPWYAYDRAVGWEIYLDEHGDRYGTKPDGEWARQLPEGHKTDIGEEADARFIAEARTAVPRLLALVAAQAEQIARVRAVVEDTYLIPIATPYDSGRFDLARTVDKALRGDGT